MQIFRFGEYWSTDTFFIVLTVGFVASFLAAKGCRQKKYVLSIGKHKLTFNVYYFMLYLLLLFLYTFKSISYGADTDFYVKTFLDSTQFNNSLNVGLEPLFKLFNYCVRKITDSYIGYFFFSGLFVAAGYTVFIKEFFKEDCNRIFVALISVQFFYDMNIMRSGIGGTFLLLSLCLLKNKQIKKAIIVSGIGALFQVTLIVNIPCIILYYVLSRNNTIKFGRAVGFFILAFIGITVVSWGSINVLMGTRYSYYLTTNDMNATVLGNWNVILSGFLAWLILYNRKEINPKIDVAITSCLMSVLLIVPVVLLGAYRLTMYFYLPRLVLWGYAFNRYIANTLESKIAKNMIAVFIVVFYTLFVLSRRSFTYGYVFSLTDFF